MKEGKIFFAFAVFVLMINFTVAVRLPVVGSDTDAWGDILNEFLGVSMNSDGTLRNINNSVSGTTSIDGTLNVSGNITVPTVCLNGTCQSSWDSLSSVPAGMIAPFNLTSCPTGWILADGSSGTPDLRGIFIRGSGTNSILKYANGTYFSATQGSYGNDSFQSHIHRYIGSNYLISGAANVAGGGNYALYQTATYPSPSDDGTNGVPRTGAETTPAYYSTIYCVKTTEDSATSNSIWTTSGNNVQLANASKNLNISGNLTLGLGQIAYNSSANKYYYYNTTSWVEIGSGASSSSSSTNYVNSIVDSGNNSYGSYIKFIDGTMIQWGSTPVTAYPSTINFPTSFSNRNYTFTSSWNSRNVGSTSDTTVNERPFTSDSLSHAVNLTQVWVVSSGVPQSVGYLDWYATGRWTETPYDNSTITVGGGIPSGAIVPFNRTSCPVGWTLADGSNGTPDLRGIFIRGSGTNSILKYANGSYFSSVLGSYANDSFQGHWHNVTTTSNSGAGATAASTLAATTGSYIIGQAVNAKSDGINGVPRTGAETSPAYYSTIYCVKMTEDTSDSNTIWATSGDSVLLSNSSQSLKVPGTVVTAAYGENTSVATVNNGNVTRVSLSIIKKYGATESDLYCSYRGTTSRPSTSGWHQAAIEDSVIGGGVAVYCTDDTNWNPFYIMKTLTNIPAGTRTIIFKEINSAAQDDSIRDSQATCYEIVK